MTYPKTLIVGLALMMLASPAASAMSQDEVNTALRGNPEIYNGLFTAAIIKHVVDTCPVVTGPNRLARVSYFLSLYNKARGMGFSRAQIEAFVEDKAEQARMQDLVNRHLDARGVDPASEEQVCAHARAEMTNGTALGRRLRER